MQRNLDISRTENQSFDKMLNQINLLSLLLIFFEKLNIRGHVREQPREIESVLGEVTSGSRVINISSLRLYRTRFY